MRERVVTAQLHRALRYLPMIYAIGTLNILLVILICRNEEISGWAYGWMYGLAGFCLVRMAQWMSRAQQPHIVEASDRLVRSITTVSIITMAVLSTWSSWAFATKVFNHGVLIPVSLCFGATCVAHCLAPLRGAAIGVLVCGIIPVAIVMTVGESFEFQLLGISMVTIAILMVRFVAEQQAQLVQSLRMEQLILNQANSDPLTGLANRRAMMAALETEEQSWQNGGTAFTVGLIDLDGFKQVNDQHGHHAGDELLKEVAQCLQSTVRGSDLVGRLGGDEFVVLWRNTDGTDDIDAKATALLTSLCRNVSIGNSQVRIGASLGHAAIGDDHPTLQQVMVAADRALYDAKRGTVEPRDVLVLTAAMAA